MQPFKWCVIGTGSIAEKVMKEIVKTGRHKVVSAFSRTFLKAEKFCEKFGDGKAFDSLEAAVTHKDVDGVYIATPHSVHYSQVMECISLGAPTLTEKAFSVNALQAEAMIALSESKGVYLCEAMWTRFNPITKRVREWAEKGFFGDIEKVRVNLGYNYTVSYFGDRVIKPESAGGALLDVGVYCVSYAQMLLGDPVSVESKCSFNEFGTDKKCSVALKYKNGAVAELKAAIDRLYTCGGTVKGTKGRASVPIFYKPTSANLRRNELKYVEKLTCPRGYIYEFDKVSEDIRAGKTESEEMTHSDTLSVMRTLDECRKQNKYVYPKDIEKL